MTRVYGFAFGALVAAAGAYFTSSKAGIDFWLFMVGALGFAIAAAGQYAGVQKDNS